MALTIGSLLGSHEITALLSKGGMGEVYRACDSKLKREVALKVFPEAFARDPSRMARFRREAASLNHLNIAHIYGAEHGAPGLEHRTCVAPPGVECERLAKSEPREAD